MVRTRAQTRGQIPQPTAEIDSLSQDQDASSVEYEYGPTYSIEFVHNVGAVPQDNSQDDDASDDDAAYWTTSSSGGSDDDDISLSSSEEEELSVEATRVGVPRDDRVPTIVDVSSPDDSSTYASVPATRSIASVHTINTRHSSITVDSIHLINHAFKDALIREFVERYRAYIPDVISENDSNRLRIRLEDRLRSAYRLSFVHGEDFVRMRMDEAFEAFVEQYEGVFDGGRGDGGPHDRGLPQPLARLRGGAMTTRMMTATTNAAEVPAQVPPALFPGQGVPLGQGLPAPPVPPIPPPVPPVSPPPVVDPEQARVERRRERARERARERREERRRERDREARLRREGGNPGDGNPDGNGNPGGGPPDGNPDGGGPPPPPGDPAGDRVIDGGGPPPGGPRRDLPPGVPPGGGQPPDDGGGDDDPDPEGDGFFLQRDPPGAENVRLSPTERQICRVWYLANLDIDAFVPMLKKGGYRSWREIAMQTESSWTTLQARCSRWTPSINISIPSVKRLAALSLWIHCRIILGDENNVDSLDLAAVDDMVISEVCTYDTSAGIEMPKLSNSNGFYQWHKDLNHYFMLKRNPEGVPLYYVIRDEAHRPREYRDLMDELMWKIPHSNTNATYRRDNAVVYELICTSGLGNSGLLHWFNSDGVDQGRNGRKGFLSIRRCCLGTDDAVAKRASLRKELNDALWTGYGQGQASTKLVAQLFRIYSEMSALGKEFTELEKMEAFHTSSKPQQELLDSTCQMMVENKVMDFIRRMKRGEETDADGRPLTFAEFTSFLINEEKRWLKNQKAKRGVSQTSTSKPTANVSSTSANSSKSKPKKKKAKSKKSDGDGETYKQETSWNKETGEPSHRWVNSIDISVLYRDPGKVEEPEFKSLPNKCKDYFRNQPNVEMPEKFTNMKKPASKNKAKKKK